MEIVKKYFDCIEKKINILYIKVKFIYIKNSTEHWWWMYFCFITLDYRINVFILKIKFNTRIKND